MPEARMKTKHLIVGGGVTGLAYADWIGEDYLVCEALDELGGYCKTVKQDGFVWDYSGHFFHFRHKEIEKYLVDRMAGQRVLKVNKDSRIYWEGRLIDFPFQKNIHQLPKREFLECLHDLFFREAKESANFKDMLYAKFGRGIAEKFLIPYNEKLYATDLAKLDVNAMGRFFPHADVGEIIRNFVSPDNSSYNATFTYPEGGAIQYIEALKQGVSDDRILLGERVTKVDRARRVATTNHREIEYEYLISSAPLDRFLQSAGVKHDASVFAYNKVLIFNLGFDRKGLDGVHWMYFPQRELSFYRVGFYDNIFGTQRMSMYVELGCPHDAVIGAEDIERLREQVLADLRSVGLVTDHKLASWHSVVLDPAYVHITEASMRETKRARAELEAQGIHSIGRYGAWTYCSIEDNIVEARAVADRLRGAPRNPH